MDIDHVKTICNACVKCAKWTELDWVKIFKFGC